MKSKNELYAVEKSMSLCHYGVKGMKWGVRHDRRKNREKRERHYDDLVDTSSIRKKSEKLRKERIFLDALDYKGRDVDGEIGSALGRRLYNKSGPPLYTPLDKTKTNISRDYERKRKRVLEGHATSDDFIENAHKKGANESYYDSFYEKLDDLAGTMLKDIKYEDTPESRKAIYDYLLDI